ncbi:MAG: DM13 domain-containing protein [Lentisphaerae bacterium]|nr:DM13 domain-containing protein [Lentisphaerota bacterium]
MMLSRLCRPALWLLLVSMPFEVRGQVVINEIFLDGADDIIELQNQGGSPVDVSSWWICSQPSYHQISSLTVSGSTVMASGDLITLSGASLDLNATQEDVGLYTTNSFTSPSAMEDFVQYGATGDIGRTDVAVAKGIWTMTEAVTTPPPGASIQYDGTGNGASNWVVSINASLGVGNAVSVAEARAVRILAVEETMSVDAIGLSVKTMYGQSYAIERTAALAPSAWQLVGGGIAGNGEQQSITTSVATVAAPLFYRLRATDHLNIGKTATLITRYHGVMGTCTITDTHTIQISDLVYDATGIDVRVVVSPNASFSPYTIISGDLVRASPYAGETLEFDHTESLDNVSHISIWCVPAGASFGDGMFN